MLFSSLQEAEVDLIDTGICNQRGWYDNHVNDNMICAGFDKGGVDTCQVTWSHYFRVTGQWKAVINNICWNTPQSRVTAEALYSVTAMTWRGFTFMVWQVTERIVHCQRNLAYILVLAGTPSGLEKLKQDMYLLPQSRICQFLN